MISTCCVGEATFVVPRRHRWLLFASPHSHLRISTSLAPESDEMRNVVFSESEITLHATSRPLRYGGSLPPLIVRNKPPAEPSHRGQQTQGTGRVTMVSVQVPGDTCGIRGGRRTSEQDLDLDLGDTNTLQYSSKIISVQRTEGPNSYSTETALHPQIQLVAYRQLLVIWL
jgi:hypothetical protein